MKRKLLSFILVVCMLFSMTGIVPAYARETVYSGECGENVVWEYDEETQTLIISGTGFMEDYYEDGDQPWEEFNYEIYDIYIDDGVQGIGDFAFAWCSYVRSINIPASVTVIGDGAFYGMTSLVAARVSSANQNYSSEGAVLYNKDKTEIVLYASKTSHYCIIPDTVTTIAPYAFADSYQLEEIMFGTGIETIGENAFPNTATATGISVSYKGTEEEWASVEIAEGNNVIESSDVLYEAALATGVQLDKTRIDLKTGETQKLFATVLPENSAFKNVLWYSSDSYVANVDGFGNVVANSLGTAVITAKTVDGGFIAECTVYVSMSGYCGDYVTYSLSYDKKTLTIEGSGAMYSYSASAPTPWSNYTSQIETVVIGDGVTTIGNYMFSGCSSLKTVRLPQSITSIGNYAFQSCSNLEKITLPSGLLTIGTYAFSSCSVLKSIDIPNTVTEIRDYAFAYCYALESVKLSTAITEIKPYTFSNCNALKNIELPSGITVIGNYAFNYCTQLQNISIPDKVTSIGSYAFSYCYNMNYAVIPDSVTLIGTRAFYNCSNLETLILGSGISIVDSRAFYYCYNLSDVYYDGTQEDWRNISIYSNNTNLTSANIHYEYISADTIVLTADKTEFYADESVQIGYRVFATDDETGEEIEPSISTILWSSSDTNVATVDENGVVSGVSGGSAVITAKTIDSSVSSTIEITVKNRPVEGMHIEEDSIKLLRSKSYLPNIVFTPTNATNKKIAWTSSNADVAAVDADGTVWGIGEGSATITGVTEEGGYTDSYTVTVYEIIANGEYEGFTWSIDYNNRLTVTGTGAMPDFSVNYGDEDNTATASSANIMVLSDELTRVEINPAPAGSGGGAGGSSVGGGGSSSAGGTNGDSNWDENLPPWYKYNNEINSVVLSEGITYIGNYAFAFLHSNKDVSIPESVTAIGENAFENNNLQVLNLPSKLTDIGAFAFSSNYFSILEIPDGVKEIKEGTFRYNYNLQNVYLPNKLTSIGKEAFAYCYSLNNINLPEKLTSIGEKAFINSQISNVFIPRNVTEIGAGAFAYCNNLTAHMVDVNNTSFVASADGILFSYDMKTLIHCPSNVTYYQVPKTVTRIEAYAFANKYNLNNIMMDDNVVYIGPNAFENCHRLMNIEIPEKVTKIFESTFVNCNYLNFVVLGDDVTEIGDNAFSQCNNLSDINFPENLVKIGNWAFSNCNNLNNINLGEKVEFIGNGAFSGCSMINTIEIPASVTSIGNMAFDIKSLREINVSASNTKYTSIDGVLYNKALTEIIKCPTMIEDDMLILPETVVTIADSAFNNSNLREVILPEGLKTIGNNAFANCGCLNYITLPQSLETIGYSAFYNSALDVIAIPDKVSTIRNNTFSNCYNLSAVTIGKGVKNIENYAFYSSQYINWINIYSSLEEIGFYAFNGCNNINNIFYAGSEEEWNNIDIDSSNAENLSRVDTDCVLLDYIEFSDNEISLSLDETETLTYALPDETPGDVWISCYSSNNDIAEINDYGEITPLNVGKTIIRIIDTKSGKTDYCVVNVTSSGTCTDTISWSIDGDGVLYVNGTGEIPDYNEDKESTSATVSNEAPWGKYRHEVEKIVVGDGITSIGECAFMSMFFAKEIILPESLTKIGDFAFEDCNVVKTLNIPAGVEDIGEGAFDYMIDLESFSVSNGSVSYAIEDGVLYNAEFTTLVAYPSGKSETYYKTPDSVIEIAPYAGRNCHKLETLVISEGVTTVGDYAFAYCPMIRNLKLPSTIQNWGYRVLVGSCLSNVLYNDTEEKFLTTIETDEAYDNDSPFVSAIVNYENNDNILNPAPWAGCDGQSIVAESCFGAVFEPCVMITAIYSPYGKLIGVDSCEIGIDDDLASTEIDIPAEEYDPNVKFFFWDSLNGQKPVAKSYMMPISYTAVQ